MKPEVEPVLSHAISAVVASCNDLDTSSSHSSEDPTPEEVCWICLEGGRPNQPLTRPCACPRWTHPSCLARWQLQSAGTRKEKRCDFCSQELPDWKAALTPPLECHAAPIMNVTFNDEVFSFEVNPGPQGYLEFTDAIRSAFGLPSGSELSITYTCDEPLTGMPLTLQGEATYDAACHCAAISAAKRKQAAAENATSAMERFGIRLDHPLQQQHQQQQHHEQPHVAEPLVARKRATLGLWGRRVKDALLQVFEH